MRNLCRLGTTLVMGLVVSPLLTSVAAEPTEPGQTIVHPLAGVTCVDPHSTTKESEKVLEVLQALVKAINNKDWKTYADNLDDHCTTLDKRNNRLIAGKENVVADMKEWVEQHAHEGAPLSAAIIDHPYVNVTGDTAVVTFVLIRQYGGKSPFKDETKATDVFVKHGEIWKRCHFLHE